MYFNKLKIYTLSKLQKLIKEKFDLNIKSLKINNKILTKSNLNTSFYRNGDIIPQVKDPKLWQTLNTEAWCYYNNDPAMEAIYGKLYNWYAVNDPRGLAPKGWHIPSDDEWTTIRNYLGESFITENKTYEDWINIEKKSGSKMKSTIGWDGLNIGVTNSSNFSGKPGGGRNADGSFALIGVNGCWWSSSEHDNITTSAYNFSIFNDFFGGCVATTAADEKNAGFSIRCIKD